MVVAATFNLGRVQHAFRNQHCMAGPIKNLSALDKAIDIERGL